MSRFSKLEIPDPRAEQVFARRLEAEGRRDWLESAEQCVREGYYEAALRYFSRALGEDNQLERAWVGQIVCLNHLGEYKEAIAWADRALGLFPASAEVLALKGVAWGRLGDQDKALGFSDSAIKLSNVSALVWWARGDVLVAHNEPMARHCFNKAAELAQGDWRLPLWIGQTYLSCDRPAEARAFLLRAEAMAPDNPIVWHYLGVAYKRLGMLDQARQAFGHALARNPGRAETRSEMTELENTGPLQQAWIGLKGLFTRR